jgi:integrase
MPIYKTEGKKDGLQKYNVRVNYVAKNGEAKQLTRTAYGLEAAKDLERSLTAEVKNSDKNPAKKMTVQQLFDEYIKVKKYEVKESTVDKAERDFSYYVLPRFADVRIDRLTAAMLQEWKIEMEQKSLSYKTKKSAFGSFRAALNYAVKMEYLSNNPLVKVGNFKNPTGIKPQMDIYTAKDFKKYISTVRKKAEERQAKKRELAEWDYYVFFAIAFYTGLRKGEIFALKWTDLNGAYLSVTRTICQRLKGGDRETSPKTPKSVRTLQMPLPLIKILKEHKERQKHLSDFSDEFRICGGVRCIRGATVLTKNRNYAKLAKLKVIRVHDFRHSHVSLLANEGINIQEVARRLGHARVEETWNTYSHLYPREEEKAVGILNRIA